MNKLGANMLCISSAEERYSALVGVGGGGGSGSGSGGGVEQNDDDDDVTK